MVMMETESQLSNVTSFIGEEVSVQKYDAVESQKTSVSCTAQDNIHSDFARVKCVKDEVKTENHECEQEIKNKTLQNSEYKEELANRSIKNHSDLNFIIRREPVVLLQKISKEQFSYYNLKHEKLLFEDLLPIIKEEPIGNYTQEFNDLMINDSELLKEENDNLLPSVSDAADAKSIQTIADTGMGVKCENRKHMKREKLGFNKNKSSMYYCNICNKSFLRKNLLKVHLDLHKDNNLYKCEHCGKCYHSKRSLQLHLLQVRKIYNCLICEMFFAYKSVLVDHMATHITEKRPRCEECHKVFSSKRTLYYHTSTAHSEMRRPNNNIYMCENCRKCYHSKRSLQLHLLQVRKIHKCLICQKFCAYKSQLVEHMATHSSEKTLKCGECSKWFSSKSNLSYHTSRVHEGVRFKCEICNQGFAKKSELSTHMQNHTGEAKFKCECCNIYFKRKISLASHLVKYKNIIDFECETCKKSLSSKKSLLRHIKSHSGQKLHK